jgi:hypothetical protein
MVALVMKDAGVQVPDAELGPQHLHKGVAGVGALKIKGPSSQPIATICIQQILIICIVKFMEQYVMPQTEKVNKKSR